MSTAVLTLENRSGISIRGLWREVFLGLVVSSRSVGRLHVRIALFPCVCWSDGIFFRPGGRDAGNLESAVLDSWRRVRHGERWRRRAVFLGKDVTSGGNARSSRLVTVTGAAVPWHVRHLEKIVD